jgi:hypothetical protein
MAVFALYALGIPPNEFEERLLDKQKPTVPSQTTLT